MPKAVTTKDHFAAARCFAFGVALGLGFEASDFFSVSLPFSDGSSVLNMSACKLFFLPRVTLKLMLYLRATLLDLILFHRDPARPARRNGDAGKSWLMRGVCGGQVLHAKPLFVRGVDQLRELPDTYQECCDLDY